MFARLLGRSKSKAVPEASAAGARTDAEPAEAEAEEEPVTESAGAEAEPAEAKGAEAKGAEAKGAEAKGAGQAEAHAPAVDGNEDGDGAAGTDAGAEDASEGAGIPRQQSAGEAADSEAGDGARR
ncbi:hypothetical protein [Streptomyces dangxiongensis]|uniref:hypothetical protein n=1 Tax=Streptomyces dangxiongensis TaxID=1442032 RepID=UPI0030B80DD7